MISGHGKFDACMLFKYSWINGIKKKEKSLVTIPLLLQYFNKSESVYWRVIS